MQTLLNIVVDVTGLVPLIIAFYIPALIGLVILAERPDAYRVKALLWFVIGFGTIIAVQLAFRNVSALEMATTIGFSVVEIAAALALAAFTVRRLAD